MYGQEKNESNWQPLNLVDTNLAYPKKKKKKKKREERNEVLEKCNKPMGKVKQKQNYVIRHPMLQCGRKLKEFYYELPCHLHVKDQSTHPNEPHQDLFYGSKLVVKFH